MQNPADLILFFGAGFGLSLAIAWMLRKMAEQARLRLTPREFATLRIRAGVGSYRSKMISTSGSVWHIALPIQRDAYVPLRVGEEVVIEAAGPEGALIFRSHILARETDPACLIISKPKRICKVERREHQRWRNGPTA
jgi:c-di-GMP-binding flagellar brake protein YcgR